MISDGGTPLDPAGRILVVDDSANLRRFLSQEVLPQRGYQTLTASEGKQALDLVAKEQPHLIMLGHQLPDMTGITVFQELQQLWHEVPVILMADQYSDSIAVEAFRMGIRDYLVKPFDAEEALSAVERVLAQVQLQKEEARLSRELEQAHQQLKRRVGELVDLDVVARTVTSTLDQDEIFDLVTARIGQMFHVEAGSLFQLDEEAAELVYITSWKDEDVSLRGIRLKLGQGIAGQVALSHQPAVVNDAYGHEQFYSQVDSQTGFTTRSILCVPLLVQDRCTGVMELLNKVDGSFTQDDAQRLYDVARPLAIALENARLYREAQELHQAQSRFVAAVARELRSPLTAIKGYTGMLLSGAAGELTGMATESVERIEVSTERLISLMEDMLDISKLETGETHLSLEPVSLRQIVTQIVSSFRERCREKGLRLTVKIPSRLPPVRADQERLGQVLSSLLMNAYLYTMPKGRLAVEAKIQDRWGRTADNPEWVTVSVSDTGIGIASDVQSEVFDRFFRSDHPVVQHHSGRGLSLAIAKSLIELHGGQIWFESQSGKGSTFSFAVPLVTEATVDGDDRV
jgi:signal transduction histidine kinase/DNA-binding response OmpR family regulator